MTTTPPVSAAPSSLNKLLRVLGADTMYRIVLYALLGIIAFAVALSWLGILPYSASQILLQAGYLFAICYLSNHLFGWAFKIKLNLESRTITALILTLIVGPVALAGDFLFLGVTALAAMASKYLIVWGRRHIFNPAAFGVTFAAIVLGQGASWWVSNQYLLIPVLIGGVILTRKTRRWHLVASFLVAYFAFSSLAAVWQGGDPASLLPNLFLVLRHSPILFFAFVMLPEPLTAPRTVRLRIAYAASVAALFVAFQIWAPSVSYGLELSLLIANLAGRIASPDIRTRLVLRKKEEIAPHTYTFWFEPERPFDFIPGQFLEWTLPHRNADSRGVRRYFSIASSPDEKLILLTTKIVDDSSSFKKALLALKPGEDVIVSSREGEFVLPNDRSKKLAFIAGGIGITPYRSIIQDLSAKKEKRDMVLLYSARQPRDLAFREIFDRQAPNVGLKNIYTVNEEPSEPWSGERGMIDETLIKNKLPDWRGRIFYISGPEPMVKAFEKMLAGMGLPKAQIKRDYFPGYTAI